MLNQPFIYPNYRGENEFSGMGKQLNKVLDYLMSADLQNSLFPLKVVFILASAIFLFLIVYFALKTEYFRYLFLDDLKNFFYPKTSKEGKFAKKWQKIKKDLAKSKVDSQWKLSLIEAAELFEGALVKRRYPGETLVEKLKCLTEEDVKNLDKLLRACQICQNVMRDPDYKISKNEVEEIIAELEVAMSELEVL